MAFHCMNCNGSMIFDVELQQMRCEHCGSTCLPDEYVFRDTSESADPLSHFACQNCGAELEATEDSMIGICPYCGGQSMVKAEGKEYSVGQIIPFKVSKASCSEAYASYTKSIRYLPKEFKDASFIQNFTGIYMPYFQYDAKFGDSRLTGSKTVESNSRYDVVNTYKINASITGEYLHGAPFDGSKYLDDEISARAMPFDTSQQVPFNPAYLAGFYADTSTTSPGLYLEDAEAQAGEEILALIADEIRAEHGIPLSSSSTVETSVTRFRSVLFPLWFLTWRKDDRVAYAVVNGESGKVVSDLPLDMRSFWVGCGVCSLVLFAVLELLFQPTAALTSFVSLFASVLMGHAIIVSMRRIYETQAHVWDKGWTGEETNDGTKSKRKKRREQFSFKDWLPLLPMIIVGVLYFVIKTNFLLDPTILFNVRLTPFMAAVPIAVVAYIAHVAKKAWDWRSYAGGWPARLAVTSLCVSVVLNAVIAILSPVNDEWYYAGDAVCILALFAAAIGMIRIFNSSTTRPLPKLFDRQEV